MARRSPSRSSYRVRLHVQELERRDVPGESTSALAHAVPAAATETARIAIVSSPANGQGKPKTHKNKIDDSGLGFVDVDPGIYTDDDGKKHALIVDVDIPATGIPVRKNPFNPEIPLSPTGNFSSTRANFVEHVVFYFDLEGVATRRPERVSTILKWFYSGDVGIGYDEAGWRRQKTHDQIAHMARARITTSRKAAREI